jgi:1,4-alpha-glucan branching enzyme
MHDTLEYAALDPVYRKHHQNKLTFGLMYAFSENFVLPLSHDEVVHGKKSMLDKMPGDPWQRFANLRALYGFMWGYPGKKLLFMGCELAQTTEWSDTGSVPWHLEGQSSHAGMQRLVRDLNRVYQSYPAMYQQDVKPAGFEWISHSDAAQSIIAFARWGMDGSCAVVVCNFTPVPRHGFRLGVPKAGEWEEVINSDQHVYGGSGIVNGALTSEPVGAHHKQQSLVMTLPPLATVIFTKPGN